MGNIKPAPIICEVEHPGGVVWRAYRTSKRRYDVASEAVVFGFKHSRWHGSYRTKFFARRRCRKG